MLSIKSSKSFHFTFNAKQGIIKFGNNERKIEVCNGKVIFVKIYKVKIAAVMMIMILLSTLTGCTTFYNFKKAFIDKPQEKTATVQIGIYEPMSGLDSKDAEAEITGIELANEVYPNVNGKIVELVYSDNASDINAAETAIKDLVAKGPAVILGSYGSVYSLIAGDCVYNAKIPAIAMTNTNPLVTKNNSYYFRVCYVDSNQGDLLAKYVLESKKEKTAGVLLPENDDAAMATATSFTDRMKAVTGDEDAIISYEEYTAGDKDFSKQLAEIEKSGVKNVLLPGDMTDSANIIKQAKSMDLDVMFLGDNDWASDEFKKLTENYASKENIAFVNFFDAEEKTNEESEKFLEAYQEKYGKGSEPEDGTALGYDAYIVALDAIGKAGDDVSGEKVKEVLSGQNAFQGASGEIKFNNMGDPIKTAYISTWENGEILSIYTIKPTL